MSLDMYNAGRVVGDASHLFGHRHACEYWTALLDFLRHTLSLPLQQSVRMVALICRLHDGREIGGSGYSIQINPTLKLQRDGLHGLGCLIWILDTSMLSCPADFEWSDGYSSGRTVAGGTRAYIVGGQDERGRGRIQARRATDRCTDGTPKTRHREARARDGGQLPVNLTLCTQADDPRHTMPEPLCDVDVLTPRFLPDTEQTSDATCRHAERRRDAQMLHHAQRVQRSGPSTETPSVRTLSLNVLDPGLPHCACWHACERCMFHYVTVSHDTQHRVDKCRYWSRRLQDRCDVTFCLASKPSGGCQG